MFTANATAALKLVGEAYPFKSNSGYILGADSHNSVHGIREYASRRGAEVHYIPSTSTGGFVLSTAKVCPGRVYALQLNVTISGILILRGRIS